MQLSYLWIYFLNLGFFFFANFIERWLYLIKVLICILLNADKCFFFPKSNGNFLKNYIYISVSLSFWKMFTILTINLLKFLRKLLTKTLKNVYFKAFCKMILLSYALYACYRYFPQFINSLFFKLKFLVWDTCIFTVVVRNNAEKFCTPDTSSRNDKILQNYSKIS